MSATCAACCPCGARPALHAEANFAPTSQRRCMTRTSFPRKSRGWRRPPTRGTTLRAWSALLRWKTTLKHRPSLGPYRLVSRANRRPIDPISRLASEASLRGCPSHKGTRLPTSRLPLLNPCPAVRAWTHRSCSINPKWRLPTRPLLQRGRKQGTSEAHASWRQVNKPRSRFPVAALQVPWVRWRRKPPSPRGRWSASPYPPRPCPSRPLPPS